MNFSAAVGMHVAIRPWWFYLILGISTVESNWDRDVAICQDWFLKPVKIFLTIEINFYKCW